MENPNILPSTGKRRCIVLFSPSDSSLLNISPNVHTCSRLLVLFLGVSSVQFSCSAVSDSLRPHEPQHTRPPCPSPTPGVHPNPRPLSLWCHPTISSSVIPFSSCPQCFPRSGSFQMSQLFAWGGQSTGVSASTSVLPMNTQDWSPGWTGWIFLQSKRTLKSLLQHHSSKASILHAQPSWWSNSHIHTRLLENHSFD